MSQCRSAGIHPQERGGDHRRLLRHKYKPLCRQIDQHILEFLISARISSPAAAPLCHPGPPAASVSLGITFTWSKISGCHLFIHSMSASEVCYSCIQGTISRHHAESPVAMSCVLHSSLNNAPPPPAAACCQTSHFHDKISDRVLLINTFHRSLATNNSAAAVAPSLAHDGDVYGKLQFSSASQSSYVK